MTRRNRSRLTPIAAIALLLSVVAAETVSAGNSVDQLSADFNLCGLRRRANCVIDGDTFWFRRQKIRMADIDAPELSPPRCADERKRGEAAKRRLLELLNRGPFSLTIDARDQDRYARKLRTVTRKGQSLGDVLVDEGLARHWSGMRRPWCG